MSLISLLDVGVFAPRVLFQNITFRFGPGDRVGLIAGNGGGKSTLLRCVAGMGLPDTGSITLSRGVRVGFVEQDMPESLLNLPLDEAVRRALPAAEREAESWRVGVVLDEFVTPDLLREKPVAELSGGWRRMALLMRVWITQPDALLLDEPTNHLDAERIGFLERWIMGPASRTPMLIASHDRAFLDNCTTRTLFLRPGISRIYAHPYSRARHLLREEDAAQDRKHAKDAKEVDRLRRNAGELRNIGVNSGSDLLQKKSMQLRERAERLEQSLRPAHTERSGDIRISARGTHAKVLVSLRDVRIHAPDGRPLFRVEKIDVRQGERLVLMGRNGVGKSQFLAMLRRAATEALPGCQISPSVVLGFTDQGMAHLPGERTPHRLIAAWPGIGDGRATSLLAGAGFTVAAQGRPIAMLSPGQKARLGLLALRLAEPNFFLLDEPTNHVDIPGQEQLQSELLAHGVTCILVSHDRRFVEAVGTRFLLIEGGVAREVEGSARMDAR
jgi:ATPase subunit of ABC transporter with duplicated ATPase domains